MDTQLIYDMHDERLRPFEIADKTGDPIYRIMVTIQKRLYGYHVEMAGELDLEPYDRLTFLSHAGSLMQEVGEFIDWDDQRLAFQVTQGKYIGDKSRERRAALGDGAYPLPLSTWVVPLLKMKEERGIE